MRHGWAAKAAEGASTSSSSMLQLLSLMERLILGQPSQIVPMTICPEGADRIVRAAPGPATLSGEPAASHLPDHPATGRWKEGRAAAQRRPAASVEPPFGSRE